MGVVPTVAADLTTVTTYINSIYVSNTTAGALTFTVKDKQATPRQIAPAVSIAANQSVLFQMGDSCLIAPNGINWVASGAGLEAAIFGYTIN